LQQGAVAFNAQLKTFLTEANKVFIFALTHQLLEQPSVLGQAVPLLFQYQCFFNLKTLNVMKKKKLYTVLVLLMVSVSFVNAQPAFEQRSLEEALNPDGTLKRGVQGSFKVEGYTMRTGKHGEPIFVPQTQNTASGTWSTLGTGSQNGVNSTVRALAVVGNEVFVGGAFTSAGGVSANGVARFNTQTNTWSTLGTGSSNGVSNGGVYALAVVGNEVVVGGTFTSAGGVSANRVARYLPPTTNPSATQTISADGLYFFPPTGVSIFFTGVSGTGTCTVQRFDAPASNISFIGTPPTFTSQYRFVITASAFTFTSAELRFNRTQIPNAGITNAGTVSVFRRPTPGTGAFSILPNTFNASFPDEVRATTTAFSEFLLGSNDPDNPLPVELVSFRGTATAQGVQLTWQTATELNNAGFEVRRKTAGEDFVTIASYRFDPSLRGKGTTSSTTTYSFVDATVEAGKTYTYRLRSVDYDGTIHDYAQTVSVEVREPVQARVYEYALEQNYPNPFNPTTTIRYSLKETGKVSVRVYDVMGREVKVLVDGVQGAGEYSVVMDATGLSSGVYVYQLRVGGLLLTRKMVLAK
jgi:hypothetical protein